MIVSPIAENRRAEQAALLSMAKASIADGAMTRTFLELPIIQEYFVQKAVENYLGFLKAKKEELEIWQVRALELNALYASLTKVVTHGENTAERLAEQAKAQ